MPHYDGGGDDSPLALRLAGRRGYAVCFPAGAALRGATRLCGPFPRWRGTYRGVRFIRS